MYRVFNVKNTDFAIRKIKTTELNRLLNKGPKESPACSRSQRRTFPLRLKAALKPDTPVPTFSHDAAAAPPRCVYILSQRSAGLGVTTRITHKGGAAESNRC